MNHPSSDRRNFLRICGITAAGCLTSPLALPVAAQKTPDKSPPNVLFIIADDLCTSLASYRHPLCQTPNLDRLAARGVQFNRAYSQFPLCGPSRASLMCGRYPESIGVLSNQQGIHFRNQNPEVITLPQFFRQQGYRVARVSKIYHMGIPGDILQGAAGADDPQSWDEVINIRAPEMEAEGELEDLSPGVDHPGSDFVKVEAKGDAMVHADGMTAQAAIELLQKIHTQPFFLAVGMVRPHVPLVAPKPFFAPYPPRSMPLFQVPEGDLDDVPEEARTQANQLKYQMNEEQQQKTLAAYYASVSFMDSQVGRILDELERLGLNDNTLVVFTSDHGYNLGQHDCWQKLSLWEDSVRSPLIISLPTGSGGNPRGQQTDQIVELIDLYPTLVEACGFTIPDGLEGRSLMPLLKDPERGDWEERGAYTITINGRSLRTNRWRLNLWKDSGKELYDHDHDPGEIFNLAHDPALQKTLGELEQLLKERIPVR